ncbi:hypothetical protein VQ056_06040 [Paenibacillus sp. JTLBN-2024]
MVRSNMATPGFELIGRHYRTGEPVAVRIREGVIAECQSIDAADCELNAVNLPAIENLPWIAPGLVDLQINGYGGLDMNAPDLAEETVEALIDRLWAEGVTSFYPTVITGSDESIERALAVIDRVCSRLEREGGLGGAHSIAGIHLEGPFISPKTGRAAPTTGPSSRRPIRCVSMPGSRRPAGASGSSRCRRNGRRPKPLSPAAPSKASWQRSAIPPLPLIKSGAPPQPGPACPRTSATAPIRCCRAIPATFGISWRMIGCGPASLPTASTFRPPS